MLFLSRIAFKNVRIAANLKTNRISWRQAVRERDAAVAAVYRVPCFRFHLGGDEFGLSLPVCRAHHTYNYKNLAKINNRND